jgi:sugar lactone lactonase YvrE
VVGTNATPDPGAAEVFFDGTLTDPQLDHPEGVAVHPDGSVWCGGERGQIFRVEPDGSSMEQVASTGGFCLGLAFDSRSDLFVCDSKHRAVMRLDTRSGEVERFVDGAGGRAMRTPNYPAFDVEGRLYVSDSNIMKEPGPGVYRFGPDGSGELWYRDPANFANGLALSPDGSHLYVAETFGHAVFRVPIGADGGAGMREEVASFPGVLPDGLAFDAEGNLYVACYEPSRIYRVRPDGRVELFLEDPEAHTLCHPTNVAFRGAELFAANLGRWHLTRVEAGVEGLPLPIGAAG